MRDVRDLVILGLGMACAFFAGSVLLGAPPAAQAQQGPGSYGDATSDANRRFIAATGSVGSGMSVLWLMDTESKRLLVYGTSAMGKSMELRGARNINWDLLLQEYNDDSQYTPEDLEALWQGKAKGAKGGKQPKRDKGDVDPGKK